VDHTHVEALWRARRGERAGGFLNRRERPLSQWLPVHPYRSRYRYYLLVRPAGYVLVGVGKLHSVTDRVDVLELVSDGAPGGAEERELLLGVVAAAREAGWQPVRWALAATDPAVTIVRDLGFRHGFSFDFMVKPLAPLPPTDTAAWRYSAIDYI
jgi:hypothetical protein